MLLQVLLAVTFIAGPSLVHGAGKKDLNSACSKIDQCKYAMTFNGKRYSTHRFLMPVAEEIPHLCPGEQSSYSSCMDGVDTSDCYKKHMEYSDRFIRLQFQTICDNADQIKDDICSKDEPERLKLSQRVETNCQAIFDKFYKMRYTATDKMFDDTATKLMDCIIDSVTPCGEAYKAFYSDIKRAFGDDAKENYHYASNTFIDVKLPSLFTRIGANYKR